MKKSSSSFERSCRSSFAVPMFYQTCWLQPIHCISLLANAVKWINITNPLFYVHRPLTNLWTNSWHLINHLPYKSTNLPVYLTLYIFPRIRHEIQLFGYFQEEERKHELSFVLYRFPIEEECYSVFLSPRFCSLPWLLNTH